MRRWREAAVPLWSLAMALAVCAPLLRPGYVLSYDMVWVPHLDLDRPEVWGLGTGLPRAVPSDAVAGLLGAVLPAAMVQRLIIVVALFLLGLGAARLLRRRALAAQIAAATLAVWNPYIAERLVLGQWPLLVACAGLVWLIGALRDEDRPRWSLVVVALAATALTPVSGLMGAIVAVVAARRSGAVRVLVLAALVNGPWIVAGLQHASIATTDPAAVSLFEVQPEGGLGRWGAALTLGGIWNIDVVPTSRTLTLAVVFAIAMGAVMVLGLIALMRHERRFLVTLAVPGVVGLAVAVAGWLVPDVVVTIVADLPGGGLVRDGTRWLALLLPLEAVAFGAGVGALVESGRDRAWCVPAVVLALILPVAALPDLAWGVAGRLAPVSYPAVWTEARQAIEGSDVAGDILVLPFSAYRRPAWNRDVPVLDPAGRFFDRTTVTDDTLEVSGRTIRGEDPRAARIGRALDGDDVLGSLAREGIGIVVLDVTAPGATAAERLVADADEIVGRDGGLRVFTIAGAAETRVDRDDRTIMTATWIVAGIVLLAGLVGSARAAAESVKTRRRRARTARATSP